MIEHKVAPVILHRRQFIVGAEPIAPDASWVSTELEPGLHLSHAPALPVEAITDADGASWHVLGVAYQSDPRRPGPADEVTATPTTRVRDLAAAWTGRWILIGGGELELDAGGMLGCAYRTVDGRLWASSSVALLAALPGAPPAGEPAPPMTEEPGIDWFPPPMTSFPAVRRLLPSQVLALRPGAGRVRPRGLLAGAPPAGREARLDLLAERLVTAAANAARSHDELWLPLTGGIDSRLWLAVARHLRLPVRAYTFEKPLRLMDAADRRLPPRLARAAGVEHRFVGKGRRSEAHARLWDEHTAHQSPGVDRDYVADGQWAALPGAGFVLRGGVFGVGRCIYWPRLPDRPPPAAADALATRLKIDRHEQNRGLGRGLSDWVDWCAEAQEPGLDWRDRLYWEQRVGGWLADIEQGLDLVPHERAHLVNCRETLTALVAFEAEDRRTGGHQRSLIERLAPELLRWPINPPDPVWKRALGALPVAR